MEFIFELTDTAENITQKAKTAIENYGGYFSGDSYYGSFSVSGVEGYYHIHVNFITITITKKPLLVTKTFLKNSIKNFF